MEKSNDTSNNIEKSDHTPDALFTTKQNKRKSMDKKICHFCKKPGHFARDCSKKLADIKRVRKSMNKMADQRKIAQIAILHLMQLIKIHHLKLHLKLAINLGTMIG